MEYVVELFECLIFSNVKERINYSNVLYINEMTPRGLIAVLEEDISMEKWKVNVFLGREGLLNFPVTS